MVFLYNYGIWHYKKVREAHSLEQSQRRDRIKNAIIKKYGYIHYIIKDMGAANKKFVESEFQKFCDFLKNSGILISLT